MATAIVKTLREYSHCLEDSQMVKMERVPKIVCVTNGTSCLGLWITIHLLRRGYIVRVTVDNTDELEKLREMEDLAMYSNRVMGVVAKIGVEDANALSEAFDGCYGVFHTSSFIDPYGISGFTEHMTILEVRGAEKVVEACSITSSVRRLVFTSSLAACIWENQTEAATSDNSWSDPILCREKKLWFALSKTMAEKAAWSKAGEKGVNMVTVCPAVLTGPSPPPSNSTSTIAYLKGAREMYDKGVLATVDAGTAAEAHVCVYEDMGFDATGRYICFDKIITSAQDALDLEKMMNMKMGFSQIVDNNSNNIRSRIVNARLAALVASSAGRHSACKS